VTEVDIRVSGLNELVRNWRAIYPQLPRLIRDNNRKFANRLVDPIQQRYDRRYPRVSGQGRRTVRATAAAARASLVIGGARAPYMPGQEFGSDKYPQFRPWTGRAPGGRGSRGRFLYPVIREEMPGLVDEYYDSLMGALGVAFPEMVN
jgi:hypothetical protein